MNSPSYNVYIANSASPCMCGLLLSYKMIAVFVVVVVVVVTRQVHEAGCESGLLATRNNGERKEWQMIKRSVSPECGM